MAEKIDWAAPKTVNREGWIHLDANKLPISGVMYPSVEAAMKAVDRSYYAKSVARIEWEEPAPKTVKREAWLIRTPEYGIQETEWSTRELAEQAANGRQVVHVTWEEPEPEPEPEAEPEAEPELWASFILSADYVPQCVSIGSSKREVIDDDCAITHVARFEPITEGDGDE